MPAYKRVDQFTLIGTTEYRAAIQEFREEVEASKVEGRAFGVRLALPDDTKFAEGQCGVIGWWKASSMLSFWPKKRKLGFLPDSFFEEPRRVGMLSAYKQSIKLGILKPTLDEIQLDHTPPIVRINWHMRG